MTVIKHKNSTTPGKEPLPGDLERAEIAINLADGRIFTKDQNDQIIVLGGEVPSGGTGDRPTNPNVGEIFYDTTTGSLVYWDGSAWQEISSEPTDGEGYVKISGDTMTGQLNIGGTNIQLKTDGSAEFAGNVECKNASGEKASIGSRGRIALQRVDTSPALEIWNSSGSVSSNTGKIRLYPNGDAYFSGKLTTVSTEAADAGTTVVTKDYLESAGGTGGEGFVEVAGDNMTGNLTLGTDKITLDASDGSADFAGDVKVGERDPGSDTASGVRIARDSTNGGVYAQCTKASLGSSLMAFQALKGQDEVFKVLYDGSAEFASRVTSKNSFMVKSSTGGELILGTSAAYSVIKATDTGIGNSSALEFKPANEASTVLHLRQDAFFIGDDAIGDPKITLGTNGSADFAGSISSGETTGGDVTKQGCYFDKDGGVYVMRPTSSTDNIFSGYQLGNTSPTVYIKADGTATFTGTINGETIGTSDERFKENITPANPQLADITALGGILKNFDWNADAPVNEEIRATRQLGLVAQEVADICPQLVKTVKRTKTVEVEPEIVGPLGKVIKEAVTEEVDDSYLALSTNALIMKLLGAVTELQAEVAALKGGVSTADS